MAEEIRIPVSADTSRMEADISNAARRAQVTVAPTINARGLEAISRPLGKITGQADEFTKSMEAANARVLAFGASVGVLNAVAKAFGTIVSSSIEVERTLTEIAVVSGETTKNIESLGRGIFNVAKLTGTSFKDAANAALEFSRQGAGMEESLRRAQAALVLTRTTGLDATESVRGLTAAVSSFNDVGLDYEKVVNKLAAVDTKFAVSSRDLIEGITRSASVAQEAGVSFDELTALITTLQEKTARGGAVIGNALKTIFTRVQGTENLDLLRSLGIAVNDVEGNILPATTIIKKLAAEIQNLDDATRKSVLIKIGGGFQIDKLSAVLKDVADANGVFARSLSESQTAANQAFTKVEQLGKTTGAAFDKLVLSSNELASNIGKIGISGNLKNLIEGLDSVVGSVNKAITGGDEGETIGNKLAQGIIAGIGSVLSGPGLLLAVGVGLKLLTNFGKFLAESVQTQLGVNTAKKEQASLEKDIFSALTKNQDVQTAILSLEGNKAKQAEYILGIYKQQAAFLEKMSSISKTIAPVLYEGGIRSSTEGVKDVKKAAGGFVPIGSAIAEERKNSPAGSRIIVDNNFPMGGGKTGTMVYNSNERRVRNFAGTGGDAIIPNYRPKSAAKGYIPNFASGSNNPAVNTTGLPDLVLDASRYGIAGLTIGGDEDVIRARFKRENLIDAVKKDPLLSKVFQKYGAFGVSNVPVGNVYRRENKNLDAIKAKEEDIKNLFKSRANATLSPQIGDFIKQELSYLQIKPTEAMDYALKEGQKFDFINDQTAGNFFEIMLKAANMDFLDDNWGQFTAASGSDERSSFDIYNLKSGIAKEYGLPEKNYDFVEVKARKADLVKDLTRKTINELLKGGSLRDRFLTDYGKGISAAGGYIPNFAKKEMYPQKASVESFKNLKNAESADPFDSFEALINVIRLQKDEEEASQDIQFFRNKSDRIAKELIGNSTDGYKNKEIHNKYFQEWKAAGADSSTLQSINTLYDKYTPGKENTNIFFPFKFRIQGLLGEIAASKFLKRKILNKNSYFDLENNTEVKTRKKQSVLEILKKGINGYLRKNKTKDGIKKNYPLGDVDLVVPSDTLITASKGYIPNFAKQLTGTGAGMLYQDPDFTEIGGGQTGKFLAPKSGQGFGQKIFYKPGNEKISQEYNVNKALSDFESKNPSLFKENAISFTKVGQLLNRGELLAGFERELINESGVDEFATSRFKKNPEEEAQFAFFLSERMAQLGVRNVLKAYTDKYGQDSLKVYDIYAQNFKINKIMQDYVAQKTMEVYDNKKDAYNQINGLPVGSYNAQAGGKGGFHTMFDTMGAVGSMKTASGGYIPNFAKTQNISGSAARFGSNIGGALESGLPLESIFDNWKGTRLLGTNVGSEKQGERWLDSTIVDLYEDSIVASILGNNTFFTPSDDQTVLKQLETFVLKQSAQGAIINTGRSGFAGLGSQVYDVKPENILQAKVSGKFKKIDYTKLAKVFPRLWRAKGLGDVWERVKLGAKYVAATNKSFYGYKNPESYKASQELRENTAKLRNAAIDAVRKYDTSILGFNVGIENTDDAGYIAKETLGTVSDKNLSYLMPFSSAPFSNIESLKVKKDREHAKIKQDRQEREARKVALKTFIQQVIGGNYKAYSTWKEWQYGRSPELKKLLDEFESIPGNPSTGVKEWISSIKYDTASKRLKAQSGLRIPNFANGIPNFSEGPLMDAIQREKLESGLPISAISVVKDNKLKNPQNPSGLAVINKRDEPNGKIPNFAEDRVTEIIFNSLEQRLNQVGGNFEKAIEKAANTLGTTIKDIEDRLLARIGSGGGSTGSTGGAEAPKENTSATKENTKEKQKETKTVQDSLYNLLKWQTILSFTSGVLSKFGDDAGRVGDALSGFGTALLSTKEGFSAVKGLTIGDKSFSKAFSLSGRVSRFAASKAEREGSGVVGQGLAAVGGFVKGGGLKAAAGAAGMFGVGIIAAIEAFNGIDKTLQILARTSEKSKNVINTLSQAQEKYSVSLDATGKKIQEQVSERFNVSGAGLSGFANQIGLTGLFRGETTKNILKTAGITNLDNQSNAALAGDIASFIIPTVQANAKEGTPFYKLQKQVEKETVRVLKEVEDMSRERIGFTPPSGPGGRGSTRKLKNGEALAPGEIELKGEVNQAQFEKNLLKLRDQQIKKADDATYKLKLQQEILTANATALRKNLDITQELAKAYASIPSSLENSLSLLRESAFTSESEKDSLSFKIKILEEERRLRADINDIALSTAKEEISKKISEGKALTPQVKGTIETGFAAINQAVTLEEKKAKIKELTRQLTGQEKDINDGLKQIIEEKLSLLDTEIQKAQTLSDIRKQQIAQENFNNSIIKQQNFYFQAQKDVFSGYLALKEQALQKEKERLGYVRQIQDAEKELSRIGKDTPRDRFQQTLEDINIEKNRKIQDAQIAARESFLANQRNVVQKLAEKPETQDLAGKALGAKSRQELINIGKDAFKLEENSFEQSVVSSAKEFYDIIIKTAVDYVAKSQPVGNASAVSNAIGNIERAAQNNSIPSSFRNQKELIPKVSQEINNLRENLKYIKNAYGDQPNDEVKNLEERIKKLQEFNDKLKEQVELTEKSKKKFNELNEKNPGFIEGRFGITAEPDTGKRVEEAQVTAKTRTAQARYAELQRTDFRQGMRDSLKSIDTDLEQFGNTLGKQIPLDFRNGLVDAMKALSDPNATTSLKERLLGVASAFLNKINESLMTNFANKITGTIFGNGQGNSGIIGSAFGMSTGGQITKGSGYKDDVPAMLMKGEYVIKKSAVSKYGKSFLDKLNQGKMQGYANGGMVGFEEANLLDMTRNPNKYVPYGQARSGNLSFDENGRVVGISNYTGSQENKQDALSRAQTDFYATRSQSGVGGFFTPGTYGQGAIMGQRNLLAFATQGLTGTQNDVIRGSGNAASIDIAGGSANLSLFALRNQENLRNVQYSEAQKKALDLYFGGVSAEKDKLQKEEEARKQIEEFKARAKKEKDAMIKGFLVQIGTTLAMAGISAVGSSMSSGWSSASQAAGAEGRTASFGEKFQGMFTGGTLTGADGSSVTRGGLMNMFSSSGYQDFSTIGGNFLKADGSSGGLYTWQNGGYNYMGSDMFDAKFGGLDKMGMLGYDQVGAPVLNNWTSPSAKSNFSLSKLNPMNLFKSFGSSIGSAVSRRNTFNTNELGFGSTSLNSNQASYYEDAEVTINGRTFTAPVNVIDGEASYMDPNSKNWKKVAGNYSIVPRVPPRMAAGGYVAGNGMGDNVPAMLNGGEFVISKQAAQNIGYNNLQKMNSSAGGGTSDEFASRIEAKLEELVEKVAGVGTINISVESGKNGGAQEEEQSNSQDSKNRDMARKIKEVVLNVLREEKRIGGMLR